MDDLFAVWDRPCIKHASRKWAWADVIMPLRWNFQNKILEFQGVQIEAGDANDIRGRTSYVEQVPEPLSLDWWPTWDLLSFLCRAISWFYGIANRLVNFALAYRKHKDWEPKASTWLERHTLAPLHGCSSFGQSEWSTALSWKKSKFGIFHPNCFYSTASKSSGLTLSQSTLAG